MSESGINLELDNNIQFWWDNDYTSKAKLTVKLNKNSCVSNNYVSAYLEEMQTFACVFNTEKEKNPQSFFDFLCCDVYSNKQPKREKSYLLVHHLVCAIWYVL